MRHFASCLAVLSLVFLPILAGCGVESASESDLDTLSQAVCCGANCCCIGGETYSDGDPNPENACQVCDSAQTHTDWSEVVCPDGDACEIGTCDPETGDCDTEVAVEGTPCDPDDGLECTEGACDEEGACIPSVAEGCAIDDACFESGAVNPANPCEVCDPSEDAEGWSPASVGTVCGEQSCTGGVVTEAGTCDGAGSCEPGYQSDCGAYRNCDGDGCATSCTNNGQCNGACTDGECVAQRADGETCTADNQCASEACVNGRCCEEACEDACMGCSAHVTGEANGTCAPILDGLDPRSDCEDEGAESCGSTGVCDGAGSCRLYDDETECAAAGCEGGFIAAGFCDGEGACMVPDPLDCGAYACEVDGCRTGCSDDAHCAEDHVCDEGACVPDEDEEENGEEENGEEEEEEEEENGGEEEENGEAPGDEEEEAGGCGGCATSTGTTAGAIALLMGLALLRRGRPAAAHGRR
jgi:hypothetical protein